MKGDEGDHRPQDTAGMTGGQGVAAQPHVEEFEEDMPGPQFVCALAHHDGERDPAPFSLIFMPQHFQGGNGHQSVGDTGKAAKALGGDGGVQGQR